MDQLATIYSFWTSQRYFQVFKHNRRAFFEDHLLLQSTLLMVAFQMSTNDFDWKSPASKSVPK